MEGAVENAVSPPNNNNDLSHSHHIVVKGKRTKRMRPHSPLPLFNLATSDHHHVINHSPPPSMAEEGGGGTANNGVINEEDEDMANCLILLSQGNPIKDCNYDNQFVNSSTKFTSKRYIETPISSNGKAGMYVYQCKTCGRTFPSFQALGGHRASHKKPKNMAATAAAEAKKVQPLSSFAFSDDEEEAFMIRNYKSKKPPALSLELSNWGNGNGELSNSDFTNKSPHQLKKIHECSYCGAQFTSGQALGGHMRRHRGGVPVTAPATPSTNTTLSLSPFPISPASINQDSSDQDDEGKKRKSIELSLDLNLPAPEDHDHHLHGSKHQQIKQKQPEPENKPEPEPSLVLSTGRFIECRH